MSKKMFEKVRGWMNQKSDKTEALLALAKKMTQIEGAPPLTGRELAQLILEFLPAQKKATPSKKIYTPTLKGQCSVWPRRQDKEKIEAMLAKTPHPSDLLEEQDDRLMNELLAEEDYYREKEAERLNIPVQGMTEAELEQEILRRDGNTVLL